MKNTRIYKNINEKKAFTLVEIMIAIMITTIVLTSVYAIWSKVSRGISRSATRQKLQNELRKAANYMQNDFKSIKLENETFKISDPNSSNFSMTFEKYKETEEGKLAQDSTEKITYERRGNMLIRTSEKGNNILTMSCDEIEVQPSKETNADLGKEFEEARKAKLDIVISGLMKVPGTGEEMYHVEKTSVVMRDEYNKNTNKTFISTFDLIKKDTSDVIVEDTNADGILEMGQALDLEFLKTLSDDVLEGMDQSQIDQRNQAMERLDELNEAIKDTDTGESGWSKFWNGVAFWDTSEGEKVRGMRSDLAKIKADVNKNEKDLEKIKSGFEKAIKDVEDVKAKLEKYTKDKETAFLNKATDNRYSSMSAEEKKIYERAYEMKLQDRNIEGGYKKQYDEASDEDKKNMTKPTTNYDRLSGTAELTAEEKANRTNIMTDKDGKEIEISKSTVTEENAKVLEAYNSIHLNDWMGEFGKESEDIGIYNAAKQLITQADTKIDVLRMQQTCQENIAKIETAMQQN